MTQFPFYFADVANAYERRAAEYVFEQTEPTPWTPRRRELRECKAALITTAGLRLKTQVQFQADRAAGTAEWREITIYAHAKDLAFDFTAYGPQEAERDLNVLVPVDRLKELVDKRELGQLSETFFSFFGLCHDVDALKANADAVGRKLREEYDVDVCFVIPASFECNQTAGVVARELERAGLSTVALFTVREVPLQIRVPRPVFINFPFGRTLGPARAVTTQRAIVGDMVRVLKAQDRPGRMVELAYKWEGTVS